MGKCRNFCVNGFKIQEISENIKYCWCVVHFVNQKQGDSGKIEHFVIFQ